jgi:hypothetical protein
MSYNGSGTFIINSAGQPVVTGTVISSTSFNALTADLANGLSNAITKDGQTTATANIPMGSNKFTGLGAGSSLTDSVNISQLQNSFGSFLTISGSNTITGSLTPPLTAYTVGARFSFVAGAANTTATTINVNSLGAKNLVKNGTDALIANDITSGKLCLIEYDGTNFQLINPSTVAFATAAGTATNATNATNATYASNPVGGGSFITSLNISAQSVAGAVNATYAGSATNATNLVGGSNQTFYASGNLFLRASGDTYFQDQAGSINRAYIDSLGNLLVGASSINGIGTTFVNQAANVGAPYITLNKSYSGVSFALNLLYNSSQVGSVVYTDTFTAFNTTSDYRLKENVIPMINALAKVSALKPVTYTWKSNGSKGQGFIAHELQAVVPDCVTGQKDAVDAEGKPHYQGVDTSYLVATLTAAIQEQQILIVDLQSRLTKANL